MISLREPPSILSGIAVRLVTGVLTLFFVSIVVFSAMSLLPGDFATSVLGQSASPETVLAFRQELGLDQPAVTRYFDWLGGILHGDFGTSFAGRVAAPRSVADIILPRLANTLMLAGIVGLIAVPLAISCGVAAALYRNSALDRVLNGIGLTVVAFPEFFLAYILIFIFSVHLHLLPSLSTIKTYYNTLEIASRLALPVLTLVLVISAHMMRMTRAAIIGVLASPYIEMARLKGVKPRDVIVRHALPNAWAPIVNVVAFNLAYLVVGVVVVEVVFVYPGIGQAMVDAVRLRDMPVVQACTMIFAGTYIALNMFADLVSVLTNPRLRYPQ